MTAIIKCRLKEILNDIGMTQKQFAKISGLRECTISEICRDSRTTWNVKTMSKVADTLSIIDMNDLFKIEYK